MENIHLIKNKDDYSILKVGIFFLLTILLLLPWNVSAIEGDVEKTLIVYYSRTGKTKLICETLKNHLGTDSIQISDLKDREGTW